MDPDFTIHLTQTQADFLNSILPKNNSFQLVQKVQRRRKAEKKLDEMYVAQFSLRPVKKPKPEHENKQSPHQKSSLLPNKSQINDPAHGTFVDSKNPLQIKQGQKEVKRARQCKEKLEKSEMQAQKQEQVFQPHKSRSQRVSKPTVAFLQFQEETFKRKVVEKNEQKMIPKAVQSEERLGEKEGSEGQGAGQQVKEQGEKMDIQKQALEQKQKQPMEQEAFEIQIQGGDLPITQNVQPTQKQKLTPDIVETLKNVCNEHLILSPGNQPCKNQRNSPAAQSPFQPNKIQGSILQNSQEQMPKVKSLTKQIVDDPKKGSDAERKSPNNVGKETDRTGYKKRSWGILQKLKSHKSSWPFRHPVDPQTQGVPDYFDKIKNPMDLKTIEKKLRTDKYKSQQDFYTDVNLMLQNSFQYNPPTTKYYKLTLEVEDFLNQLKSKSYLPKTAGRNSTQNDEEQSDYQMEEENQANTKKTYEKYLKDKAESEEKFTKSENRKRTAAQFQSSVDAPAANRKIAKVFITTEGPVRKEKKTETQNEINQSNIKIEPQPKSNQIKQSKNDFTKSAQVKQIDERKSNKKQIKPIKIESGKKDTIISGQNNAQMDTQKPNESRFGYPHNRISLIERQTLLYDILHIESAPIRNQIESFLDKNNYLFNKFKHGKTKKHNGQNVRIEMEDESYELELKDMDRDSYRILRSEVDRLMGQEVTKYQQRQSLKNKLQ